MPTIVPFDREHLEAVVRLALRAWEPVFPSIEEAMGTEIFRAQVADWRASQTAAVEAACTDGGGEAFVALIAGEVAGFVALRTHAADRMGEIHMIAVDPRHQRRGIAAAMTRFALARFAQAGLTTAMVETGGDPGHAPARSTYEAAGFRHVPVARYFKKL
ncbi:MAG: GNAT family N-acetyltransferase [Myxococcota bacterium]